MNANYAPSRNNTLTKKASLKKRASLRRSKSGRSLKAGSMRAEGAEDDFNSVFYTPIPTKGSPTDVLADRFQGKCFCAMCEAAVAETDVKQPGGSSSKTSSRTFARSSHNTKLGRSPW